MLSSACLCRADEVYTGGVTVNIDRDVFGYVWIEDATVNLLPGAHVKNAYYMGDVFAASGAVLNIYGGQIDSLLFITTAYNGLPDAQVTVYGTQFAVNGVPVDPSVSRLFLTGQVLSGLYGNGTPFAFRVDCFAEGTYQLTLRLHWIVSTPPDPDPQPDPDPVPDPQPDPIPDPVPDIEASLLEAAFGQVEVDTFRELFVLIANTGDAPLIIHSVALEQDALLQFYTTALGQMPLVLRAGEQVQIGLLYAPAAAGQAAAALVLRSNDPAEGQLRIALTGEGFVRLTCAQQIEAILTFFDQSVRNGTLVGQNQGKGKSAASRLEALRQMLKTAQFLIAREQYDMAILTLRAVKAKTDGEVRPGDFVTGSAVAELNEKVLALIKDLKKQ